MVNGKAEEKIIVAKVTMQKSHPFFSYLVMNLKVHEKEEINTCAVDVNGNFYYNPEFVNKLTKEEIKSVLAHEVMHIALLHLIRLDNREIKLWNVATDLVINNLLIQNGFKFDGSELRYGLIPAYNTFQIGDIKIDDIDKKVAEEIYNELLQKIKEQEEDGKGKGKSDSGDGMEDAKGFDKHIYAEIEKLTEEQREQLEKHAKKMLTEANAYSKMQGKEVSGIERMIDALLENKLNWREILYRFITKEIPIDFTYARPSKKSEACGFYMPSTRKEQIEISVAIDTSGSIGKKELTEFLSELVGIAQSFDSLKVHVLFWDTTCGGHYIIDNGDIDKILNFSMCGGGGTDFTEVNNYISNEVPNNKVLVFFTDGYAQFPTEEQYKTLWVLNQESCGDDKIPFGEIVRL